MQPAGHSGWQAERNAVPPARGMRLAAPSRPRPQPRRPGRPARDPGPPGDRDSESKGSTSATVPGSPRRATPPAGAGGGARASGSGMLLDSGRQVHWPSSAHAKFQVDFSAAAMLDTRVLTSGCTMGSAAAPRATAMRAGGPSRRQLKPGPLTLRESQYVRVRLAAGRELELTVAHCHCGFQPPST